MGNIFCHTRRAVRPEEDESKTSTIKGVQRTTPYNSSFEYKVIDKLGTGSTGVVWRAKRRRSDRSLVPGEQQAHHADLSPRSLDEKYEGKYALKTMLSKKLQADLEKEIKILDLLNHKNILELFDVFELKQRVFMVTNVCAGSDLNSRDPYTESEASYILQMVISAVCHMHHKNVVHRDLKYENVMFVSNCPRSEIKIIDFGSSTSSKPNGYMRTVVGTIQYMAPQVFQGKYTSQADLWSVGVLAYMLLSSRLPFFGDSQNEIMKQILSGKHTFVGRRWKKVSNFSKDLVSGLLQVCEKRRLTAEEAFYIMNSDNQTEHAL